VLEESSHRISNRISLNLLFWTSIIEKGMPKSIAQLKGVVCYVVMLVLPNVNIELLNVREKKGYNQM